MTGYKKKKNEEKREDRAAVNQREREITGMLEFPTNLQT
jgi:hypothetical protein